MPDWKGFSGMYKVGTDDSSFYAGVADDISSIPTIARGYIGMDYKYVNFLKLLYPFKINHPLTIIVPNLIGIGFIPYLTYKTSYSLTGDHKTSKIAFILVMICPVILSNGLILMRDGWTAFLIIAGIYYLLEKRILQYIIALLLLSYLRLGSGILLAIAPLFYLKQFFFSGSLLQQVLKILAAVVVVTAFFSFGLPLLLEFMESKGVSGFARQEFVETFIKRTDSDSVIYAIYTKPAYLQVPLGFLFFLFAPFLTFQFYTEGVFNIRNIMFTTIMPILSLVYFRYFFSGVLYSLKKKEPSLKRFIFVLFFMILIISQLSIQPRHKTSIMPLFYILVAFGVNYNDKLSRQLSLSFAILLGLIQVYTLI
ncbi:MAG: EpsG family protein [Bacteroidales bacterium]|nr:EpsG family protein [Bacteroidales bacterium]